MHSTVAQLGALSFGSMLIVACIDGTAPVYGAGCTAEPQGEPLSADPALMTGRP